RLLLAIEDIVDVLPQPVIAQVGHTPFSSSRLELVPFVGMDKFVRLIAESRVVVMHAGAGSIIQACISGRTPIVLPRLACLREALDEHQTELATAMRAAGKILVANDTEELRAAAAVRT